MTPIVFAARLGRGQHPWASGFKDADRGNLMRMRGGDYDEEIHGWQLPESD